MFNAPVPLLRKEINQPAVSPATAGKLNVPLPPVQTKVAALFAFVAVVVVEIV
jgi:hypothetical protein